MKSIKVKRAVISNRSPVVTTKLKNDAGEVCFNFSKPDRIKLLKVISLINSYEKEINTPYLKEACMSVKKAALIQIYSTFKIKDLFAIKDIATKIISYIEEHDMSKKNSIRNDFLVYMTMENVFYKSTYKQLLEKEPKEVQEAINFILKMDNNFIDDLNKIENNRFKNLFYFYFYLSVGNISNYLALKEEKSNLVNLKTVVNLINKIILK